MTRTRRPLATLAIAAGIAISIATPAMAVATISTGNHVSATSASGQVETTTNVVMSTLEDHFPGPVPN